ncbi:DUF4189 domain-containing protein [Luteimonas sp. 3794]|uniref:DUF4189 domain-containing protein n=1 Tax=Luteimonas sp. 3794 TaxID=2817730 RepID=UPI00285D1FD6|nr:DUF4189 domain-containing protein [Luteimonas sp. 3794]MDR6991636.1 hypothetical protein [Luteimonas sp. 3794]
MSTIFTMAHVDSGMFGQEKRTVKDRNRLSGRSFALVLLASSAAIFAPISASSMELAQAQVPESNPASAYYHSRYLPALGVANTPQQILEDRFGAFAMSPSSSWSGWVLGDRSKAGAEKAAIDQCSARGGGVKDCEIVLSFQNQCATVASTRNHSGFGRAGTIERARALAMRQCESIGPGCEVFREGCSYPEPAE